MFLKLFKFKIEHPQNVIYYWLNILALPVLNYRSCCWKNMKKTKERKNVLFLLIVSFTHELIIHAVYKIMLQIYETAGNAFWMC